MDNLRKSLQQLFSSPTPIPSGTYHFQAPPEDPRNFRLHLRVEPDGRGILIINAATVLHLNQTAAEYAYYLIQDLPEEKITDSITQRYRVKKDQAAQDYHDFKERIRILIETPDLDPVTFLGFDRQEPFTGQVAAPYRLDCAITYQLPQGASPEAAPTHRVARELTTQEWFSVLDKAWEAGIPHIVFTGGEPTLREDLPALIQKAEANSQVTGLITDGARLSDSGYFETLLNTGLDHLALVIDPQDPAIWGTIQNVVAEDIFVTVHLTLTPDNAGQVNSLLKRLAEMGVHSASLSTNDPNLEKQLQNARDQLAFLGLELVWDIPVPYSFLNPVALEILDQDVPQGAGRAWLYVEPDGDVLPAQGISQVLGNMLRDPWEKIWAG